MTGFLTEIGQKLADRWAAALAIPGLLYVTAVTVATVLGQGHALSYPDLSAKITAWATSSTLRSTGGAVLLIAAVLAGSVAIGLAAMAGGRLVEVLWTLPGDRWPLRWLAERRRRRSRDAKRIADTSADPVAVRQAIARADRICLVQADSPTWIGDRLRACRVRIAIAYGIDLNAAWPRLWLVVPDAARAELGTARDAFSASARLAAWAVLYLILAIWWWPSAVVALVVGTVAVSKGRLATTNMADLIESAVDLYGTQLATQLGQESPGGVTPAVGELLSAQMRKDRWDPRSALAD